MLLSKNLPLWLSLAAVGVAAPVTNTTTSEWVNLLQWADCPEGPPGLQCASLEVPLDYKNPSGKQVNLGLTRVQSPNANRTGSLVYGAGGPGQSSSEFLTLQALGAPVFTEAITGNFDLVGMDYRGIGMSERIKCDPALWNERSTLFPRNETEFNAMVDHNKAFWKSCEALTGDFLYNVDTLSIAKDLDRLRSALNEQQLNYLGSCYGSQPGQTFAQLYPDNYRALVFDAIFDHGPNDAVLIEGKALNNQFESFLRWCAANQGSCALKGSLSSLKFQWSQLITSATTTPIPAPGCDGTACMTDLRAEDILFNLQIGLSYSDPFPMRTTGFEGFSAVIASLIAGDATPLSEQIGLAQSQDDPRFAGPAISCLDWAPGPANFKDFKAQYDRVVKATPLTRAASGSWQVAAMCLGYPIKPTNPQGNMKVKNAKKTPILLVQSEFDPQTSVAWAENVAEQIENNWLVEREGDGHTSYFLAGESTRIVDEYLVGLKVPKVDTVRS